jgi:cardiolipin synthase
MIKGSTRLPSHAGGSLTAMCCLAFEPVERYFSILLATVAAATLAACTSTASPPAAAPTPPTIVSGPTALLTVTEPDQGLTPVYDFLTSARRSVDMTMYELSDPEADSVLAADAARGIDVRVVLDQNRERQANSAAFSYLRAHGVHVVWAPSSYDASHEKAVVVDDQRAMIMTMNLTSRYYATTRDFVVIDPAASDVGVIEAVFDADYRGASSAPTPRAADLVWSPGSQAALVSLIASARTSLAVENEEMSDRSVVDALEAAARRGVRVEVTMTDTGSYHSDFAALESAGVAVHTYPDDPQSLYIHAKVIVADGATAFVGSENFSVASLGYNRELGLITSAPGVVGPLATTLSRDFAGTLPWSG